MAPPKSRPGRSHNTPPPIELPGHLLRPAVARKVLVLRPKDKPWITDEEWLAAHRWRVTPDGQLYGGGLRPVAYPQAIRQL